MIDRPQFQATTTWRTPNNESRGSSVEVAGVDGAGEDAEEVEAAVDAEVAENEAEEAVKYNDACEIGRLWLEFPSISTGEKIQKKVAASIQRQNLSRLAVPIERRTVMSGGSDAVIRCQVLGKFTRFRLFWLIT
ncbi:hypothetical protein PV328_008437 [Microctonus aethiopoides]|uniref:Uncharacterized protein n=1 Tax=Microctonus aethiopoides TaxID=144406 RepID=A0AA39FJI2_9HYME|nr:hypothetical protein PV328_008437 [Microctonus aethiopoides]